MLDTAKTIFRGAVEGLPAMSVPATALAAFTSYFQASGEAFILWICLSTLDLIFGMVLAVVNSSFKVSRLYHWVFKICIQMLTIVLFAVVLRMFAIASGVQLFFESWLLLFFGLLDFSSIMDKFLQLGYLPKPAYVLLKFMRKRSAKMFAAMVNEPRLEREMRKALGDKEKKDKELDTYSA